MNAWRRFADFLGLTGFDRVAPHLPYMPSVTILLLNVPVLEKVLTPNHSPGEIQSNENCSLRW